MPVLSALEAATPALERIKLMLFRPFRVKTWIKIGFIGWLAGVMGGSGGNYNYRGLPSSEGEGDTWKKISDAIQSFHISDYIWIIAVVVALVFIVSLIFLYLSCRFRFVLFDSVISGDAAIGRGWRRYRDQAHRYFGFWIIYTVVVWLVLGLVAGLPLWRAYKSGVFRSDSSLGSIFAVLGTIVLGVLLVALVGAVISSLASDFVVPLLALDDLRIGEAWSTLQGWIRTAPMSWAAYLGMKLVFSIASGIGYAIVLLLAILILAIPTVIIVLLGVAIFKGAGSAGIAIGIGLGVVLALAFMAFWLLLTLFLSAPIVVFFQSYSLYFLGGRYPKLGAILWPSPPPVQPAFAGVPTPPT